MATRPQSVPVCDRCRRRKQKCTTVSLQTPCTNCVVAQTECTVTDPERGRSIPRAYVARLEEHIAALQSQIDGSRRRSVSLLAASTATSSISPTALDPTTTPSAAVVLAAAVSPKSRYLGASSGLAFVESAIQLANSRGILGSNTADDDDDNDIGLHDGMGIEFSRSKNGHRTRSLEGLLPVLPTPPIPDRMKMEHLFADFAQAQWQHSILTQTEFDAYLDSFYGSSPAAEPDATVVVAYMVFAICVHFVGGQEGQQQNSTAANLADAYHQQALGRIGPLVRRGSLASLQAVLLLLLYSIMNPQRPIVWHLLGSAIRLTLALGLNTEAGCRAQEMQQGTPTGLPCRLFWSLYGMDRAVGHTLGRPTMLEDRCISVGLPSLAPFLPAEHGPQEVANHCFRIRQIQSEVADVFYQRLRPPPLLPLVDYRADLRRRLERWRAEIPAHACAPQMRDWLLHSYYNTTMFVCRPCPANPTPSTDDLQRCFAAVGHVLRIYARLHRRRAIDATWMAMHWLFLAAVTHLFCLWTDAQIRQAVDWAEVGDVVQATSVVLSAMTERWGSGRKMLSTYRDLARGTLRRYTIIQLVAGDKSGSGEGGGGSGDTSAIPPNPITDTSHQETQYAYMTYEDTAGYVQQFPLSYWTDPSFDFDAGIFYPMS